MDTEGGLVDKSLPQQREERNSDDHEEEVDHVHIEHVQYDWHVETSQLATATKEFCPGNFLKGCKWSPDGLCLLTCSNDNILRLFNLPQHLTFFPFQQFDQTEISAVLHMKEADTIYDYCWYPAMHSSDPQTCCLVSSAKDQPIHMFDAFSGSLRGSYCSYNHLDEVTSAYSLAFSPDGSQLFSGFNQLLRIFDVTRPGRFAELRSTMTDHGGISGIISCIAFSPTETGVYALGSYNKSIAIYSPDGSVICVLQGQHGGVTHIMFSPDGNRLYTGGRKDAEILCWDVREPGRVLFKVVRDVETNQRIYFDLDRSGRYLVSGHHSGLVTVWDTDEIRQCDDSADNVAQRVKEFSSHKDTVNGVSFHPWLPMLATSCGQRQFLLDSSDDSLADLDVSHREENSVCLWSLS